MGDPNKPPEVVEEEQLRAWALRVDGWEMQDIAKQLGISLSTAKRRVNDAILNRELPTREAAKLMSLARQDRYLRIVHDYLGRDDLEPADAARLLSEARQLDREQRRVLGVDEPTRTHTTVTERPGAESPKPEILDLIEKLERGDAPDNAGP